MLRQADVDLGKVDRELFLSLLEARVVLEQWRIDDNQRRPHGGLKWLTKAARCVSGLPRRPHNRFCFAGRSALSPDDWKLGSIRGVFRQNADKRKGIEVGSKWGRSGIAGG